MGSDVLLGEGVNVGLSVAVGTGVCVATLVGVGVCEGVSVLAGTSVGNSTGVAVGVSTGVAVTTTTTGVGAGSGGIRKRRMSSTLQPANAATAMNAPAASNPQKMTLPQPLPPVSVDVERMVVPPSPLRREYVVWTALSDSAVLLLLHCTHVQEE